MGATKATPGIVRLLCLPYAGGGASVVFRTFGSRLAPVAALCPLELPGRGARRSEALSRRVRELAVRLAGSLEDLRDDSLALLGHSLGALLAFEVARELRRRGGPRPSHLFVSSRRGPRILEAEAPIHGLPDASFVEQVQRRYHAIPEEVLREPDLMELLLPTLRADFEMLETYEYVDEPPLDCPITALGGVEDARATLVGLEAWRVETTGAFQLRRFPGGHFYFREAEGELATLVRRTLEGGGAPPQAS